MGQCMERIRIESMTNQTVPMTYAGRLDPMAEGLVLFLGGEMRHNKELFLKTTKQYQVTLMFGIATDTYDFLGLVEKNNYPLHNQITNEDIYKNLVTNHPLQQKFPAYSSRRYKGLPLFMHAKQGLPIPEISRDITIFEHSECTRYVESTEILFEKLFNIIKSIKGDFRQGKIIKKWKEILQVIPKEVLLYKISLYVSSGFYVRTWVNDLGNILGCKAVTISLLRDKIGVFTLSMLNNQSYRIFDDTDPLIVSFLNRNKESL